MIEIMKKQRTTLYNSYDINYDEYYESFIDFCEMNDIDHKEYDQESERFLNWVYDELDIQWDDLKVELKHNPSCNEECVVLGDVGRWNGTYEIQPTKFNCVMDAIMECVKGSDYIKIYIEDGEIYVIGIHHDGRNVFSIHRLNQKGRDIVNLSNLEKEIYHSKLKIV